MGKNGVPFRVNRVPQKHENGITICERSINRVKTAFDRGENEALHRGEIVVSLIRLHVRRVTRKKKWST